MQVNGAREHSLNGSLDTGDFVARVLAAASAQFEAECFVLEGAPPLGALVVVDASERIVGVVAEVRTEGRDPGRRPAPHGGPDDDRARVLERNPQIPALLHTTFQATVVGFLAADAVRHHLPPHPAPIYARVREATAAETEAFTQTVDFCRLLLSAPGNPEEVAAAALRQAAPCHPDPRTFLVRAGRALAGELATEPDRLAAILRRMHL